MSIFISYNYNTAGGYVKDITSLLDRLGLDPWVAEPGYEIPARQLDPTVERMFQNCDRCIVVWSEDPMGQWQTCEIAAVREMLQKRMPSGQGNEGIVVLKDCNLMNTRNPKIPLLEDCEYIEFDPQDLSSLESDLDYLVGAPPAGIVPLFSTAGLRPVFSEHLRSMEFEVGMYSLFGHFKRDENWTETGPLWLFLEDIWEDENENPNIYIQHPRPTLTSRSRWGGVRTYMGADIRAVHLWCLGEKSYKAAKSMVSQQIFCGVNKGMFPDDYIVSDTIEFSKPIPLPKFC